MPSPELAGLAASIDRIWDAGETSDHARALVERALTLLDRGEIRVAEKTGGTWTVNEWIKKAVLLHFRLSPAQTLRAGDLEWHDKVPLKTGFEAAGVRAVPVATVRRGAFIEPGVVLMPSFVNIGARIGEGTMIDTWATVGSCAQVGRRCHVSGGVGIGGVLEPVQARPVLIEDDVFIGARCEVAEGVLVEEGAVLAMGCFVGASTKIFDAERGCALEPGRIPARAVCVPGTLPAGDGTHGTCAIIVKKRRDAKTDARTALNELLR